MNANGELERKTKEIGILVFFQEVHWLHSGNFGHIWRDFLDRFGQRHILEKNLVSDISGDNRSPCSWNWNHLCPCSPCSVSEDKRYPCSWKRNHLCPCQLKLDMKGKINLRWAKRRQLNWYSALYFLISFVGKQLIKPLHFLPKRSDFHSCDLLMPATSKVIWPPSFFSVLIKNIQSTKNMPHTDYTWGRDFAKGCQNRLQTKSIWKKL